MYEVEKIAAAVAVAAPGGHIAVHTPPVSAAGALAVDESLPSMLP